jgi:DNA-binding response OmpR family regulator
MSTHLLILEEHPRWSTLLANQLEGSSFSPVIYQVASASACAEMLADHPVDLLMVDINPGDGSGFSILKTLIHDFPNLPLIALASQNNDVLGMQAIKAGAQDFIARTELDERRVVKAIRYAMLRHKAQLQLQEEARELNRLKLYFQEIQKLAKFGSWEMDIVTNAMKWADEVFRIFGFSPNSISPSLSNYLDSVHPLDKSIVEDFFETATRDGHIHRLQHRILVAGKTIKTIALQAKVNYDELEQKFLLIGGIQDITELKFTSFESF